jgi:hypothetical protein
MKRRLLPAIFVLAIVGGLAGWYLIRDAATEREIERLSTLLDRETAAFLAHDDPMPPLPGPAAEGAAAEHYLRAIHVPGWDPGAGEAPPEVIGAFVAGTRTSRAGLWQPPGGPVERDRVYRLQHLAQLAMDAGKSPIRCLEHMRYQHDLARGGNLLAPFWALPTLDLGQIELMKLLEAGRVDPAEAAVVEAGLRSLLRAPDFVPRAVEGHMLHMQHQYRAFLSGGPLVLNLPFAPGLPGEVRSFLDLNPSRGEVLAAWKTCREIAAVARAAESSRAEIAAALRDSGGLEVMLTVVLREDEEHSLIERAIVIACAAIRVRAETGELPADAEALLGPELLAGVEGRLEIRAAAGEGYGIFHLPSFGETELLRFR